MNVVGTVVGNIMNDLSPKTGEAPSLGRGLKILMVSGDGTAGQDGSAFAKRLQEYGQHVGELHVLILGRGSRSTDLELAPNVYVYDKRSRYGVKSFARGAFYAQGLVAMHKIDVITSQDPFEHGWVALKVARATGAKLHIQVHTDFLSPWFTRSGIYRSPRVRQPFRNRVRLRLADRVLPYADAIRTVSKRVRDSIVAKYGTRVPDPSVLPIRVPPDESTPQPLPPHEFTFTLVTASRLEPEKRVEDIIAAVARLKDSYPMLGVVIIGDGSERSRLEKMARDLGIERQVVFSGRQENARGMLKSAQAYIQASAYEGYGMALVEAALAGLPIVTSDVGIVGEVFTGYENVLAAPVGDPVNLAALVAQIIEDPHVRVTLSMEGKRVAEEHLASVRNAAADVVEDIARALSPHP